ncbi:MAG: hypothetical protein ACSLFI_01520, partial [Solirubrobacterales bacterium]
LALVLAWLVAPTSASGPAGEPNGFVSGLRYLAPALAVSMALLGSIVGPRSLSIRWLAMGLIVLLLPFTVYVSDVASFRQVLGGVIIALVAFGTLICIGWAYRSGWTRPRVAIALGTILVLVLAGQVVQKNYFENRYANPDFTTPGLNRAFAWAQLFDGKSIGTNATRQYPLYGKELGNEVQFIGIPGKHAGFTSPESCEAYREAVGEGDYDLLVLTLDRPSPNREFPRESGWMADDPAVTQVWRKEPTVVYRLNGEPDPSLCG